MFPGPLCPAHYVHGPNTSGPLRPWAHYVHRPIMSGPLCPRAHYVRRSIMSGSLYPRAQYVQPITPACPLCPAHSVRGPIMSGLLCPRTYYVHGPIMSGPLCPWALSGVCGKAHAATPRVRFDCEWRNHNRLYQSVPSLRSSVIESFIFLLESRWKFLMKELLICVRFSLNDSQSQVPSFDLNNDVFDHKFSPLIAK